MTQKIENSPAGDNRFPLQVVENSTTPLSTTVYEEPQRDEDDDEIDLRELWEVLKRHKAIILTIAALVFIATLTMTLMMTPIYRASVTLQINPEETKLLNYDVNAGDNRTSVNDKDFYQTQYELLKSRVLARRTIEQLGLENALKGETLAKPFFSEMLENLKTSVSQLFASSGTPDKEEPSQDIQKIGKRPLEENFLANLTINPVKNSQIVAINYDDANAERAAIIANALADNFIKMNLERRTEAGSYAKEFLSDQLVQAKSKLEESEAKLVDYAKKESIIRTDDEKQGSLVSQKLEALNTALTQAEADRIAAESLYKQALASSGSTKVLENPTVQQLKSTLARLQADYQAANSSAINDPTVQQLKQDLASLQSQYQEKLQIYKPGYPLMQQLQQKIGELKAQLNKASSTIQSGMKQQIAEVQSQLRIESSSIKTTTADSLKTDYLAAKQREEELRAELAKQKDELLSLRDKSIGYNTLQREVETNRNLYEGLLQRIKEVGVAAGVGSNNMAIVDPAVIPYAKYKPNTKLNLALGGVLGLFLGIVIAFLLEFLDDRIKSTEELEKLLPLPLLGLVPKSKEKEKQPLGLLTQTEPRSAFAEAFRSLRTNLMFSTQRGAPKVLAITSSTASEGKTTMAINLATVFAQSGSNVLLVDADMRKPTIHTRLGLDNSIGLSNYLTNQDNAENVTQSCQIPNVYVITSGPITPNPVELISGARMQELVKLAPDRIFDFIIIDSPPVLGLADALILAHHADAVILAVAASQSRKQAVQGAYKRLKQAHAHIIGTVLTKVKTGSGYGYAYYYNSDYYGYGNDKKRLEVA